MTVESDMSFDLLISVEKGLALSHILPFLLMSGEFLVGFEAIGVVHEDAAVTTHQMSGQVISSYF